jgi:hypothetical protein
MLIVKATGVHHIKYFRINLITLFVSYIIVLFKRFFSLLALNRSNLPKRKSKWTKKRFLEETPGMCIQTGQTPMEQSVN